MDFLTINMPINYILVHRVSEGGKGKGEWRLKGEKGDDLQDFTEVLVTPLLSKKFLLRNEMKLFFVFSGSKCPKLSKNRLFLKNLQNIKISEDS